MMNPFDQQCGCSDCEAAVSPAAYLTALLDYALKHVRNNKAKIDLQFLVDTLHQPFLDLPTDCEAVDKEVRQVRICIEVLRSYLGSRPLADPVKEPVLAKAEGDYRFATYAMLLSRVGTSYEEIRRVRAETDENRKVVASRLGIDLTEPRLNDELDQLFLDLDTKTPSDQLLTEQALERLFSLSDTTRDPLSEGAKLGDDKAQVTRWNLDGVVWGQNTNPDGFVYVTLANPAPTVFRVELYQDSTRKKLVASGEIATAKGTVKLVAEPNGRLSGVLDIDYTADSAAISIAAVPAFLSWQLKHLRTLWSEQDYPTDAYSNGETPQLPIIDPDLIGPDDFRNPTPKTAGPDLAFDFWLARRQFVDATLSNLKADREAKDLNEILKQVLGNPIPDIDGLLLTLTKGGTPVELKTAKDSIAALNLSVESFTRLMAVRAKDQLAQSDARNDKVSDVEWLEVYSILTQALKERQFAAWRAAEDSVIELGLQEFWFSVTEPKEGDWPPLPVAGQPLIDPDIIKVTDLPDWLAGKDAIELWNARKVEIAKIPVDLKKERDSNGFDAMLRLALGHPAPGNPLQHDPDTLQKDLDSTTKSDRDTAAAQIMADFHITVEAFNRVMEIKAANDQTDPAKKPVASEWAEVFAILTPARKMKHEYPTWVSEESSMGFAYWKALKAKLPRWRAAAESRQAWQQGLRARSQPPIIDSTMMGADDLQRVVPGDPAFDLWKKHFDRIISIHGQLKAAREALDPDAVKGLDQILHDALGFGSADLAALDQERQAGHSIENRLEQLNLLNGAFDYLMRIQGLANAKQPVTESEWDAVYSTLTEARIQRESTGMRVEEQNKGITLGPDWFKIPDVLLTPLPFLDPFTPRWLSTWQSRRDWQDKLQSRIDQADSIGQGLQNAVDAVEEATLPVLRDALIVASDAVGSNFDEQAEWITRLLLLDARSAGCQMTTRIAQATETVQTLIFDLRSGQLKQLPAAPLSVVSDAFDEEWKWIGSYASWRSAMFVSLYPENILQPSLLKDKTTPFNKLVSETRGLRLDPETACNKAASYADYFRDICSLEIEATCQASTVMYIGEGCDRQPTDARSMFYMFGRASSGKVYWSAWSAFSEYAQGLWKEIEGFTDAPVDRIVGAMPYTKTVLGNDPLYPKSTRAVSSYIYVFCVTDVSGTKGLRVARLNLDHFGEWSAPVPLDVSSIKFDSSLEIVPVQSYDDALPGGLVFHTRDSDTFYLRRLNRDGTDWDPGYAGWQSFFNTLPLGWKTLRAVLWVNTDVYWFVLKYSLGAVRYSARMIAVKGGGRVAEDLQIGLDDIGEEVLGAVPGDAGTVTPGIYVFSKAQEDSPTTRYVHITAAAGSHPFQGALADLTLIPPHSGRDPTQEHQVIAYRRDKYIYGPFGIQNILRAYYMYRYAESADRLIGSATIRAVPTVRGDSYGLEGIIPGTPLTVQLHGSSTNLQQRRKDIIEAFALNADAPPSVLQYLREAYYFVPLHLALALQSAGHYFNALDCFRTVYDYEAQIGPPNQRNIYYGLELDATLPDVPVYQLANNWLLDPLDPHSIAATRRYAYTRFTLMSLARCLLDFADSEFTQDNGESLAQARTLYLTALELLQLPALQQKLGVCDDLIAELKIEPGKDIPPEVPAAVGALMEDLTTSGLHGYAHVVNNIKIVLNSGATWAVKLAGARSVLEAAQATAALPPSNGALVAAQADGLKQEHAMLLKDATLDYALQDVGRAISAKKVQV